MLNEKKTCKGAFSETCANSFIQGGIIRCQIKKKILSPLQNLSFFMFQKGALSYVKLKKKSRAPLAKRKQFDF